MPANSFVATYAKTFRFCSVDFERWLDSQNRPSRIAKLACDTARQDRINDTDPLTVKECEAYLTRFINDIIANLHELAAENESTEVSHEMVEKALEAVHESRKRE